MCRGRGHGVALVEGMEGLALMGVRRAGIMVGESVCSWGGGRILWDDEALYSTFVGKLGE